MKRKPYKISIQWNINAKMFYDKKAKSWVIYNKHWNISGYGKTSNKAEKMFLACVNDILIFDKKPHHHG